MAVGTEINLYGVGDVDLTALMNTVDLQRVTFQGLSLTNYDNTALPAIAAGSLVEVAGALFKFASEEAITGWGGIGDDTPAYIKLVPAGTDPDTVTAEFTDTAPVWSDAKQWWYGTGGAANHKYIGGLHRVDAATYYNKYLIKGQVGFISGLGFYKELITDTFRKRKVIELGDWNMDATPTLSVAHGLSANDKIRKISVMIRHDDSSNIYPLFSTLVNENTSTPAGGINEIGAVNIILVRTLAQKFDGAAFNSTSYNRGWITIEYEA